MRSRSINPSEIGKRQALRRCQRCLLERHRSINRWPDGTPRTSLHLPRSLVVHPDLTETSQHGIPLPLLISTTCSTARWRSTHQSMIGTSRGAPISLRCSSTQGLTSRSVPGRCNQLSTWVRCSRTRRSSIKIFWAGRQKMLWIRATCSPVPFRLMATSLRGTCGTIRYLIGCSRMQRHSTAIFPIGTSTLPVVSTPCSRMQHRSTRTCRTGTLIPPLWSTPCSKVRLRLISR